MNIGFSSFILQGGQTGISTYVTNLLQQLQYLDHQNNYHVFVPETEVHLLPPETNNFHYHSTSSSLGRPLRSLWWHNQTLPKLAREQQYDLVYIPSYRRVPFKKSCRLVATIHDIAPWSLRNKYDALRTFYNRCVVPHLLKRCDHLITVSKHTKQDLVNFIGLNEDEISVIYPGVDHKTYRPMEAEEARELLNPILDPSRPFLVYVSRIEHPGKNHISLLKAFETLKKKQNLPHQLILPGAYWAGSDFVRDYAARSRYAEEIHFCGFVSNQQIVALYSTCDLMVHPSLFEGFGFPAVEALACGARVICSNNSSLQELAEGRMPTFNPKDPMDLADCIDRALQEKDTEQAKAERIAYANTFSWPEAAKKILDVYRRVV